jgi:hypothetical protein
MDEIAQLNNEEWEFLRSQIATAKIETEDSAKSGGKRRFAPYVFTEPGVAMLSSVINSEHAIAVNIQIMRTFIQMRHYALTHTDTDGLIFELRKLLFLYIEQNDKRVNDIIRVLNNLTINPPVQKAIGFKTD